MAGHFPARAGVPHNIGDAEETEGMPHSEIAITDMLQDAKYRTAHIGKWHLGHRAKTRPNGQGFDFSFGHMQGCIDNYSHFFYWHGPNRHDLWLNGREIHHDGEYFGNLMRDYFKQFISEKSEQPFFVYMAINWPHYPLQGTKKWRDFYGKQDDLFLVQLSEDISESKNIATMHPDKVAQLQAIHTNYQTEIESQ